MRTEGKPAVLVLGATSMVGSDFVEHGGYPVTAAGRVDPTQRGLAVRGFRRVDLAQPEAVEELVRSAPEATIVNFSARTDVDGVEKERPQTDPPSGGAWKVNALAPEAIARATRAGGKGFLQVSTDFVFDGTSGPYDEDAARSPLTGRLSWYGWTKGEGERRALEQDPATTIVRISYPYRTGFPAKLDFARWMLARRREGTLPALYGDQQITPTWIPDLTAVLASLLRQPRQGIFHVASPAATTPWEFATELIARQEGARPSLVRSELGSAPATPGRAPRPLRGGLRSRRAEELGVQLTPWRKGVERLVPTSGGRP